MAWFINLLKSQNSYNWVLVILTSFSVLVLDQAALVWPINCRDSVSAFHPGVLGSNLSSPVRQVVILCCLEKGTASKQNSYQHCKNKVTSLTRHLFGRTSLPSFMSLDLFRGTWLGRCGLKLVEIFFRLAEFYLRRTNPAFPSSSSGRPSSIPTSLASWKVRLGWD